MRTSRSLAHLLPLLILSATSCGGADPGPSELAPEPPWEAIESDEGKGDIWGISEATPQAHGILMAANVSDGPTLISVLGEAKARELVTFRSAFLGYDGIAKTEDDGKFLRLWTLHNSIGLDGEDFRKLLDFARAKGYADDPFDPASCSGFASEPFSSPARRFIISTQARFCRSPGDCDPYRRGSPVLTSDGMLGTVDLQRYELTHQECDYYHNVPRRRCHDERHCGYDCHYDADYHYHCDNDCHYDEVCHTEYVRECARWVTISDGFRTKMRLFNSLDNVCLGGGKVVLSCGDVVPLIGGTCVTASEPSYHFKIGCEDKPSKLGMENMRFEVVAATPQCVRAVAQARPKRPDGSYWEMQSAFVARFDR